MEREGGDGAGAGAGGAAGGEDKVIGALAADDEGGEAKAEAAAFFAAVAAGAEEEEEAAAEDAVSLRASRNMAPRSASRAAAEARTDEEGGHEGRRLRGPRAVVAAALADLDAPPPRHGAAVVVGTCLFFRFSSLSPGFSVSFLL